MLNIAYIYASVDLVIVHYYMLQNKQSNRHSQSVVVLLFAYPTKLNISTSNGVTKILPI